MRKTYSIACREHKSSPTKYIGWSTRYTLAAPCYYTSVAINTWFNTQDAIWTTDQTEGEVDTRNLFLTAHSATKSWTKVSWYSYIVSPYHHIKIPSRQMQQQSFQEWDTKSLDRVALWLGVRAMRSVNLSPSSYPLFSKIDSRLKRVTRLRLSCTRWEVWLIECASRWRT